MYTRMHARTHAYQHTHTQHGMAPRWTLPCNMHCAQDGYTLNTTLVCLLDNEQYPVTVDNTVEFYIRQAHL